VKLAVSGKGGVGKTTLSAMLCGVLALQGRRVVAVDADPDANLASALGISPDERITPLAEMEDLIAERTGSADQYGGYFRLNPRVDDIPEKYARRIGNIRLLVLGGVSKGGAGCICPATALLKALLIHLSLADDEHLIMDMEAGIEHLGRATAQSMDALIVVVEESPWSTQTAQRVRKLALDIGMTRIFAVANRVDQAAKLEKIGEQLGEVPLIGHLPTDARLVEGIVTTAPDGRLMPSQALADHQPAVERILAELKKRT
jgi:CO dehydrogenase maturation factor